MAMKEDCIALTQEACDKLMEYSTSLPSGTVIGKQWKRDINWHRKNGKEADWHLGEYIDINDPINTGIKWLKIVIREAGLKASEVNGNKENYELWNKKHEKQKLV